MKNVFSTQETKAKAPLVAPQLYGGASTYSGRVASGVGKLAEFAKDIGQGIARNVGSVALSGINLVAGAFGQKPISLESPKDVRGTAAGIQRAVFGEKPVQDIATRTQSFQKEHTALSGPAGSFAPAFVVGGIVLDLTGFGAEKNILSDALLKSKTVEEASNILRKAKVPEQVVEVFAPRFAIANEKKIVDEGIEVMQQLGKSVPEQKTALKSAFTPEDTTRGLSQQSPEQLIPKLEGEQGLLQKTGVVDQKSVSLADNVPGSKVIVNDDDAIAQLTKGIQDLKPIREQQEALYSNERARRVAEMVKAREGKSGIESFYAELGALKGALTKVEFESLAGKIDPQVVTRLFDIVRDSPHLRPLESKDAREGLLKLFGQYGATVPTRSEIALLERVFPKATIDALVAKQPLLSSIYDKVVNLAGLSKSLRSIGDLSAPFRQGIVLVGRKEFWKSFTKMFGQAVSPEKYKAVQAEIESLPYYQLMEDLGLPINTSALSIKEEQYIANKWAENLPLVGSVVRASERGYTGFLNYLRASTFSNLITEAKQAGVELTPDVLENLVKFIGNATGRGSLGGLERSAGALSTALFSPRLIASRLSLLNPLYYHKLDPFTRKQAVKSMLSFGAIASAIVIMAKAGGAEVGDDPLSSDFGKIKIKSKSDAAGLFQSSPAFFGVGTQSYDGKIRYDLFGGFQQYIRLAAQLKAGKIVSSTTGKTLTLGEGYKPITRQDIINRFFRGKASPVASFIMNWLDGTDTLGNKFELTPSLINLFVPIMKETIEDAISPPQVEPKKSTRTKATPTKSKSTKPKPTGTSSKMKSAF